MWIYSAILSREWELYHKVDRGFIELEKISKDLFENSFIKGLDWKTIDWDSAFKRLDAKETGILKDFADKSLKLTIKEKAKEFPDYQGQFLHTLSESMIDALSENNVDLLKSIFVYFFHCCLIKYDDLRPRVENIDWRIEQQFKIAFAPLLDLLEISGYSFLMSEYFDKSDLWNTVKIEWDKYLSDKPKEKLTLISLAISITETPMEIAHRSIVRSGWQIKINRELSKLARQEEDKSDISTTIPYGTVEVEHASVLVRTIAKDTMLSMFDGTDIFSCFYLMKHKEKGELKFGRKGEELSKQIDYEKREDEEIE